MGNNEHMFARVYTTDPVETVAVLEIFGRRTRQVFYGNHHHDRAVRWVNTWNEHLGREWMNVRACTAEIVQNLIDCLQEVGVEEAVIERAVALMKERCTDGT